MSLGTIVRSLFGLFLAGIVLVLVYMGANIVAVFVITVLPFGMLGGFGEYVALFIMICIMGAVGRWGIRYIP